MVNTVKFAHSRVVYCSVVYPSTVWCSVVECGAVWCSVIQYSVVQCNTFQEKRHCSVVGRWQRLSTLHCILYRKLLPCHANMCLVNLSFLSHFELYVESTFCHDAKLWSQGLKLSIPLKKNFTFKGWNTNHLLFHYPSVNEKKTDTIIMNPIWNLM